MMMSMTPRSRGPRLLLGLSVVATALLSLADPSFAAPARQRPGLLLSRAEATGLRNAARTNALIARTLEATRTQVAEALGRPIEVPLPGEGGGPAHERHKQNYRDMKDAGLLFQITRDERYARLVRDLLDGYAKLYPTLGPHPLAHNQAPGKIFHQTLNDAVWLVNTAVAYDCVYDWLPADRRALYEKALFRPMASYFSEHQATQFNRIHNHGTWAVAAVGMIGYVMGDQELVDRALYGTKKDRQAGFLRQLDLLFSPDGYYMEGPYYIRFALLPFYSFAEAIERHQPQLRIYEHRDRILAKALMATVQTAYPDGVLPPINDASRVMDVRAEEIVLATNLAYARHGKNPALLGVAAMQDGVVLNGAGLEVARALAARRTPPEMSWPSVELSDGHDGLRGGLGLLRTGQGRQQTVLLMKYGVHGGGHGHFDQLHFSLYDGGGEVVPDYGFARWVNMEPKFGGRYLPENDSYAMQTIAHNTITVDGRTQNGGDHAKADAVWPTRHFFDAKSPHAQAMSARADRLYDGVGMQRTLLLVDDARLDHPVVVDLFRLTSATRRRYDYPLHFRGLLVSTNVKYQASTKEQRALGTTAGYEHIWETGRGKLVSDPPRVTWLDGRRYYTFVTAAAPGELIFGRTGAGDPNFNLFSEPMLLVRREAGDHLFASVIEPHGLYDLARERSQKARGDIQQVRVIGHDKVGSAVEVTGAGGLVWTVLVSNAAQPQGPQRATFAGRTYEWTGPFAVQGLVPRKGGRP
jgi:oligo-alginate lyase